MNLPPLLSSKQSPRPPVSLLAGLGLLFVLTHVAVVPPTTRAASELRFADTAFERLWATSDAAIAAGATDQVWHWGPGPLLVAREPYAEGVGGQRLVQYFDKGRMEITRPTADRDRPWFVTAGLLTRELVSGQIQIGDLQSRSADPAWVRVAGDHDSPDAPTYVAFRAVATIDGDNRALDRRGQLLAQAINGGGRVREIKPRGTAAAYRLAEYDSVTGHNVLAAFTGYFARQPGVDWLAIIGRPITEPYWIRVRLNGRDSDIVVQLFERRVLTYTPTNPEPWRVEMGNIGQHYAAWRYGGSQPQRLVTAQPATPGLPVRVRGFNWPPHGALRLMIGPPGAAIPTAMPPGVLTDGEGSFETTLPWGAAVAAAYARHGVDLVASALGPDDTRAGTPLQIGDTLIERVLGAMIDLSPDGRLAFLFLPSGVFKQVELTDQTVIRRLDGEPGLRADLATGVWVEARGRPTQTGMLLADQINIVTCYPGHAPGVPCVPLDDAGPVVLSQ